jgi:hypothetical protein
MVLLSLGIVVCLLRSRLRDWWTWLLKGVTLPGGCQWRCPSKLRACYVSLLQSVRSPDCDFQCFLYPFDMFCMIAPCTRFGFKFTLQTTRPIRMERTSVSLHAPTNHWTAKTPLYHYLGVLFMISSTPPLRVFHFGGTRYTFRTEGELRRPAARSLA